MLLCLFTHFSQAQSFYRVQHLSGTQTVAGNDVTVHHIGYVPNYYSACNTGPYRISSYRKKDTGQDTCRAYIFAFSEPVTRARVRLTNIGPKELISIHVNGTFYPLSQGDVSDYGGTCKGAPISVIKNGRVGGDTSNTNAMVTLAPGFPIDSIMVYYDTGDDAGVHFSFEFESNPKIAFKQPFYDTTKCIGDSLYVRYEATAFFNSNNVYSAELSDAHGSFANPVIIGSTTDTVIEGKIPCMIPANTPKGAGYRIRITTTSPARVTSDNGDNIRITPYPEISASSNSPVCEGDKLKLMVNQEPETNYYWTGGNSFTSTQPNPVINNATTKHSGGFIVSASTYNCVSHDTISVLVKPLPSVTGISNNSPLCEMDTIKLNVKSQNPTDTFYWNGPGKFTATGAEVPIHNIHVAQAGVYSARAYFNGCFSDTAKTEVVIKTKPAIPEATNNSPVYPGDPLQFEGRCSTPGVTLAWNGPDGFSSNEASPVIPSPDNNAEGDYTLTATLGACTSSITISAIIIDKDFYTIYPNPNNGTFKIKINVLKDQAVPLEVVNDKGETLYREVNNTSGNVLIKQVTLDKELPPGMYILRFGIEGHSRNVKFRIAH